MIFFSFLAGAIASPILLYWLAKKLRVNETAPSKDLLVTAKRYLTLIANNSDEPTARKIAEKALKEIA